MFQKLSKKLRKKKGFTLIELIVVLAILGIILAIAVPNYLGVQDSAAESADVNQLDLAANGVKLWYSLEDGAVDEYWIKIDGTTATLYTAADFSGTGTDISDYLEPQSEPSSNHYADADSIHVDVQLDSVSAEYYDNEKSGGAGDMDRPS